MVVRTHFVRTADSLSEVVTSSNQTRFEFLDGKCIFILSYSLRIKCWLTIIAYIYADDGHFLYMWVNEVRLDCTRFSGNYPVRCLFPTQVMFVSVPIYKKLARCYAFAIYWDINFNLVLFCVYFFSHIKIISFFFSKALYQSLNLFILISCLGDRGS